MSLAEAATTGRRHRLPSTVRQYRRAVRRRQLQLRTLATGRGVSGSTIRLGVLTDQTGVFAGVGKSINQSRQLLGDEKNSQGGGVCDRKVEFVGKDHGYNPQQAVAGYAQVKDEVLALDELLGSPVIAALAPTLQTDQMLTLAASLSSSLLAIPYVVVTGTAYGVEMINGRQAPHLMKGWQW